MNKPRFVGIVVIGMLAAMGAGAQSDPILPAAPAEQCELRRRVHVGGQAQARLVETVRQPGPRIRHLHVTVIAQPSNTARVTVDC